MTTPSDPADDVSAGKWERRWLGAATLIGDMYRQMGSGSIEVDGSRIRRFHACYPLAMYALNQVLIAQRLMTERQHFSAQASARIAFEHAVTAQWVMLTEGAEDQLLAELDRQQRNVLRDMARTTSLPAELQAVIDNAPTRPRQPKQFEQICDRFDRDKRVYSLYRMMSGTVHPSSATIAAHVVVKDDGTIGLNGRSLLRDRLDLCMTIGWSAVLAADVIETFRLGQPHLARVQQIASQCEIPADLRHADRFPELRPADGPLPV